MVRGLLSGSPTMPGVRKKLSDESGQDLAEYGIALAVVAAIAVAAALSIGVQVGSLWQPVNSTLSRVNHGHHRGGGNSGNGGGNGG